MSQYSNSTPSPIIDFDKWAPHFADSYVKYSLGLTRRSSSSSKFTRWEDPDSGYYDDAVSYATTLLYEKKDHILSAKYPKECARWILRDMGRNWSKFNSSGWKISEWDNRKMAEAKIKAERLSHDQGEIHRLQREFYIKDGGDASVFDTIYGEPLQLFEDDQSETHIDIPDQRQNDYQSWDTDQESDPAEKVVGQRTFMDFLKEECDDDQRNFLELCANRTDTEVSKILHENVSSTNRRKKKLFDSYKSWIKAAGSNS